MPNATAPQEFNANIYSYIAAVLDQVASSIKVWPPLWALIIPLQKVSLVVEARLIIALLFYHTA